MSELSLTRRYRFAASHRLHSLLLDADSNRAVYGKCNNPYGHGHDYELEVTVRGPLDAARGRLLPVALLDLLVSRVVLEPLDHRNLNVEVPEFATLVPTTENLAAVVAARLEAAWPTVFASSSPKLEKVRIWETRRNIIEVAAGRAATKETERDEIAESCR